MNKLLVSDLDGTLLRDDKTVSTETINALLRFKNKGNKILFATARPPRDAYKYVPTELRQNPIICYNGACIIDSKKNIIFREEIQREDVLKAINILKQNEYNKLCLEVDDKLYSNFDTSDFFGNVPSEIIELNKMNFSTVFKIIICSEQPISTNILGLIPKTCTGVITDNGKLCQIMNAKTSKWNCIKEFIKRYNILIKDIIAIGDDYNDIEMIKNSGIGIAMGNANETVKAVADYVTDTNMNNGIEKILKTLDIISKKHEVDNER